MAGTNQRSRSLELWFNGNTGDDCYGFIIADYQ